jgi:hypothetical protein
MKRLRPNSRLPERYGVSRETIWRWKRSDILVLPTLGVAPGTIIGLDPAALVSAYGPEPEFQSSKETVIHYEDTTPLDIGTAGTPATVAAPSQSLFLRREDRGVVGVIDRPTGGLIQKSAALGALDRTGASILAAALARQGVKNDYLDPLAASPLTGFNPAATRPILCPTSINWTANGRKPMLNRLKRKPGGQPGNRNAVKTGRWTAEGRAAHQAACEARQEAWREECRRSNEWIRAERERRLKEAAATAPHPLPVLANVARQGRPLSRPSGSSSV